MWTGFIAASTGIFKDGVIDQLSEPDIDP